MARDTFIDTQPRLLAVNLSRKLLPVPFEHALNPLLDHAIDLSHFDARCQNAATGAPAYPPARSLKVVLLAYSPGIVSSRQRARACQEHVPCMALCGDRAPHVTTIAKFVSSLGEDIARVFAALHAGCFAMALSFQLTGAGFPPSALHVESVITMAQQGFDWSMAGIVLTLDAVVPGIDDATFREKANAAKVGCPVSMALSAVLITLEATLRAE